jgi:hypothetical protein
MSLTSRNRTLLLIAVFAIAHGALTLLAISQGLIIFHGPSTASEKFWAGAMDVLLSPAVLFLDLVRDSGWELVLVIGNSLLWGAVLTFLVTRFWKRSGRSKT